jgi:AhpC/TSA family
LDFSRKGDRMIQMATGLLILLLGLPAVQYQALLKEAETAQLLQMASFKGATEKDPESVRKAIMGWKLGSKFLALAEKYPKDPVALDALIWVMTDNFGAMEERKLVFAKASEILVRHHIKSEKLGQVCENLSESLSVTDPTAFFAAVMDKSPHKEVQAEACLALAYRPLYRAMIAGELKNDTDAVKQFADDLGKEFATVLQNENVDKLRAECERNFVRFTEKYSAVLSAERLAGICELLALRPEPFNEKIVRLLLEKDARKEVQGAGILQLAKLFRERADTLQERQPKEAAKLYAESEGLLQSAADKYADVAMANSARSGTVGKQAKKELFSLRNLSIGKVAPDIEGEDQLGKRFSLSDYRGKVVLLDFWNEN